MDSSPKAEVRRRIRGLRRQLQEEEKCRMDAQIRQRLLTMEEIVKAEVIYSYMSFGCEVDTVCLIEMLWQSGRKVAVPRVEGNEIRFFLISRMEELVPGCRGILEPIPGCRPAQDR